MLALAALGWLWLARATSPQPIRIGVLHSLSGTMAVSEKPLVNAARFAVEEINAAGGLLGRQLELLVADGKSDPQVFAAEAERLITREKVSVLLGCWTSACRQAVKPVVEKYNHLLIYPVQYEGLEQSPNILYTGSTPNQQIIPATNWAMQHFGKHALLVDSDYIFPRTANLIMRDLLTSVNGKILAQHYLPLGGDDMRAIIADIQRKKPDIIFNTLNGDSNAHFFAALKHAGLENVPLMSFSVSENEMKAWGGNLLTKHYAAWSYFQSLPGEINKRFVTALKARFGEIQTSTDPVETTYAGVKLWAQAVQDEKSESPARINNAILRQSIASPSGIIAVDANSRHLWKMMRIGKVLPDGEFEQVYASSSPLRPNPWPVYRTRSDWQQLLQAGQP